MGNCGTGIYCDCCEGHQHRQKLAEIHPGEALEIKDRRHGQNHIVTLSPREVLERISGTHTKDGIIHYVTSMLS